MKNVNVNFYCYLVYKQKFLVPKIISDNYIIQKMVHIKNIVLLFTFFPVKYTSEPNIKTDQTFSKVISWSK